MPLFALLCFYSEENLDEMPSKAICSAEYKCDKYERTTHHTTRPFGVIRCHFWIENLNLRFQRNFRKDMSHTADKMSKVKKVYSAALTIYKMIKTIESTKAFKIALHIHRKVIMMVMEAPYRRLGYDLQSYRHSSYWCTFFSRCTV